MGGMWDISETASEGLWKATMILFAGLGAYCNLYNAHTLGANQSKIDFRNNQGIAALRIKELSYTGDN